MSKAEYGNGESRSYEYDKQGRVTRLLINGTVRYAYTYNSEGSLTQLKDVLSGVTYSYVYDLLGRPVRVSTSTGFGIRLTYDEYNRTSDVKFEYGSTSLITTWRYGTVSIMDNSQKSGAIYGVEYNGTEMLTYQYDNLARRTKTTINTSMPFTTTYSYKNADDLTTSTLLEKISYSGDRPYIYTYDANGNITGISTESNGTQTQLVSYEYDALNQLVRENNAERNKTIVYTYDNGGNITSVKEYAYTTGEVSGTPAAEKTYTYGNTEWKDLLTNYNGTAITYDTIGNPLNWTNGKTFTWTAGRQLAGVTDAANNITYTYDDSGIRTSKTVNGTKTDYYLNGTAIIMQKTGDNCIWYTYDENGNLSGLRVGNSEYYYYRNGQGDIIGIIDGTGSIAAKYSYDAWGTPVAITDGNGNDVSGNANHIANINPFRYRGYFYDTETGLYYLQSRYYDPQVGRFINADGYVSTGQDVLGNNMFVYCGNNSISRLDPSGQFFQEIVEFFKTAIVQTSNAMRGLAPVFAGCAGAAASDGPLPIGDILGIGVAILTVIGAAGYGVCKATEALAHSVPKTESKDKDITISLPTSGPTFYGVDMYGGTWKPVTGPMTHEQAIAWVDITAKSNVYGKNASWGLYTQKSTDASIMAMVLGGGTYPEFHPGNVGEYPHYHVSGYILFNKYKHFHVWFGNLN